MVDRLLILASILVARRYGRPLVGWKSACIPNPFLFTRKRREASSDSGKALPSRLETAVL